MSAKNKAKTPLRRKSALRFRTIQGQRYPVEDGAIVVEEHRLTPAQVKEFEQLIEERREVAKGSGITDADNYAHRTALGDLLWRYRPTSKAKSRVSELGSALSDIGQAISQLRDYTFCAGGEIGASGCAMLQRLATLAEQQANRIRHFSDSMAAEWATTLPVWTQREREFKEMNGPAITRVK